jgi:hypothetical protein
LGVEVAVPARAAAANQAATTVPHQAHIPSGLKSATQTGQQALPPGSASPGAPNGYIPCDIWNAYHMPGDPTSSPNGAGKLIAIIDPFATIQPLADLRAFDAQLLPHLPDPPSFNTYPDTSGWGPNSTGTNPDWPLEIAIDIEWAHALAPGAAIALVYGKTADDVGLLRAVDIAVNQLNADVVSMSWTIPEAPAPNGLAWADIQAHDLHFPATNGAGRPVTYVAATGDDPSQPPNWPADSFRVVGVGGTSIPPQGFGYPANPGSHTNCAPALTPGVEGRETDWQTGPTFGSAGGTSDQVPRPAYQAGSGNRMLPDVAMLANPAPSGGGVAVYEDAGWDPFLEGGTSVSTAMWAGVIARLDQVRGGVGLPPLLVTPIDSWVYDLPAASFNAVLPPATNTGRGSPLWQIISVDAKAPPAYAGYFSWYDNASPGMENDDIHIVNPSATSNVTVTVTIPGCPGINYSASTTIPPQKEIYANCSAPITSGPIKVTTLGGRVIASQRVEFNSSFNEIPAMSRSEADYTLYFTWYDRVSDVGFIADNVHVFNPSNINGLVTASIPGCPSQSKNLPAGAEVYFACAGFMGPVVLTANVPILGSQRVQFYSTFNEVNGMQLGTSTVAGYFTWYDEASSAGFTVPPGGDTIHVINPMDAKIHVTVNIPGCAAQSAAIDPGRYWYFSCAGGYGGPVTVTSTDGRFLASARTRYYQSFNEVVAMSPGQSGTTLYAPWFDRVSSTGFTNDNVHVINIGSASATITAYIPPCGTVASVPVLTPPGKEAILTCATGYAGPVVISSPNVPVLASQRVQFFQTFNEAALSG